MTLNFVRDNSPSSLRQAGSWGALALVGAQLQCGLRKNIRDGQKSIIKSLWTQFLQQPHGRLLGFAQPLCFSIFMRIFALVARPGCILRRFLSWVWWVLGGERWLWAGALVLSLAEELLLGRTKSFSFHGWSSATCGTLEKRRIPIPGNLLPTRCKIWVSERQWGWQQVDPTLFFDLDSL